MDKLERLMEELEEAKAFLAGVEDRLCDDAAGDDRGGCTATPAERAALSASLARGIKAVADLEEEIREEQELLDAECDGAFYDEEPAVQS